MLPLPTTRIFLVAKHDIGPEVNITIETEENDGC